MGKVSCVPAVGGAFTDANISAVDSVSADTASIHAVAGVPTSIENLVSVGVDAPAVLASSQVPVVSGAAVGCAVTDFLPAVEIPGVLLCLHSLLLLPFILMLTFPSAIVAANVSGVPGARSWH
jgi:hypothetical protein